VSLKFEQHHHPSVEGHEDEAITFDPSQHYTSSIISIIIIIHNLFSRINNTT
jgi:hypothetical protein